MIGYIGIYWLVLIGYLLIGLIVATGFVIIDDKEEQFFRDYIGIYWLVWPLALPVLCFMLIQILVDSVYKMLDTESEE